MEGLKIKYRLKKADGSPADPDGVYFVIKLNSKDAHHLEASHSAALAYAEAIEKHNPELANELREKAFSSLPYWGDDEHPEGYEGLCGCSSCLGYE